MATATVGSKKVTRTVEVEEDVVTLELTPQEARDLRRVLALVDSIEALEGNLVHAELLKSQVFANALWGTLFDVTTKSVVKIPLHPSWED